MLKERRVILRVEDVLRLMQDYCSAEDVPADAWVKGVMIHPRDRKVALIVESEEYPHGAAALEVKFDIRRLWGAR